LYAYVNGNPIGMLDSKGLAGAIPKNFGKGRPIEPILSPIEGMRKKNAMAEDLIAAIKGWLGLDSKVFLPDDTFACDTAECYVGGPCSVDSHVRVHYFDGKPALIPVDTPWPPIPGKMPTGCVCIKLRLRPNMSGLKYPGL
jgi:hypothetical protein